MGYESRLPKPRQCKECKGHMYVSAEKLADHARLCKRAADIGLILPKGVQDLGKHSKPRWS